MLPDIINIQFDTNRINELDKLASKWRCLYPKNIEMQLAQQSYDDDFLVRMAYNSNAIEGSTLTLAETEVIYEGEFVPGKPGREQIAARGLFDGAAFIETLIKSNMSLNESHLRDLHECCALDLQPGVRGTYRNAPAIIRASRTTPSSPLKIREELADLFYQYAIAMDNFHPLLVIPWFHACMESIHPFADGNGRTGRLWMNAQLQTCAFPPINIKVDKSVEYKTGLEAWQVDENSLIFMELFISCLEDELLKRIEFLSQGVGDEGLQTSISDRDNEVLGILYYQPAITASSLGKILNLSERQVQRILKALVESGKIKRTGSTRNGKWIIQ